MAYVKDFANISSGFTHIHFIDEDEVELKPKIIKKRLPVVKKPIPESKKSEEIKKKVEIPEPEIPKPEVKKKVSSEPEIKLPLTTTILFKIPLPEVRIVEKKNDINVTTKIIDILKNIEMERVSVIRKGNKSSIKYYDLQEIKNFINQIKAIPDLQKFSDNKDIINHKEIAEASKKKTNAVAFITKLHEAFIKTP